MFHLNRSVRQCAVMNKIGVRYCQSASRKLMELALEMKNINTAKDAFSAVASNTIHQVNLAGETGEFSESGTMGSLLYPGSLSTTSMRRKYMPLVEEIQLMKLIDFSNMQVYLIDDQKVPSPLITFSKDKFPNFENCFFEKLH